jgi:hypothetical protein
MTAATALLIRELEQAILRRTGRRIRDLDIEIHADVVHLRGRTSSYHLKQQAQHGVRDLLPDALLENQIEVGSIELLPRPPAQE